MKYLIALVSSFLMFAPALAQSDKISELWEKYRLTEADTAKARILDDISENYLYTNIDSAIILNNKALSMARKHHHKELEGSIRKTLTGILLQIGASQLALEIQFELLADAIADDDLQFQQWLYNSIAMNYMLNLGDLENGKKYSYMSMQIPGWERQKKYCVSTFLNLGDTYTRSSQFDSARHYLNKAFELALNLYGDEENDYTSMIKNNFGNLYLKMNQPEMAMLYYRQSMPYALRTSYTDVICESGLGMAKIYENLHQHDSVLFFANKSLDAAIGAKYLSYIQVSSDYLADYYVKINQLDSAVKYFSLSETVRDSLLSTEKVNRIKAMEMQKMIRDQKRKQAEEDESEVRRLNIQYAILIIGIVSLLLLVLLLSRSFIVHHNLVRFLGVMSLLLVFEFINLYLHPVLVSLTSHSPVFMLLIMAGIASLLIPIHHKLEYWVANKLVEKNKKIRLAQAKKIIDELEDSQDQSRNV